MAILMPDRTRQIVGKIFATSNPQSATIYTPSSASVLGTTVNYNGGMARIRVCAFLDSIPETHAPVILPTDTLAQKEQKNQFFRSAPKKGLMAYLESPTGSERYEAGLIDLYNVKPNFLTGVNEFFSDLRIFGIQFGWKIVVVVVDRGHGLLQTNTGENQQNDYISITGFADETSSFLQGDNDTIYNFVV
ncbi:hypothetical protein [Microcoleus sp. Pol10D4]|uniref:hypothetical protein n=1 Tax=Microcoleus sp. Pol10D4 TaxID=3055387 RepID=UPI002FD1C10C